MTVTAPGLGEERCCLGRIPFRIHVFWTKGISSESGRLEGCPSPQLMDKYPSGKDPR